MRKVWGIGIPWQAEKLEFGEEKPGIEQHCHSEPVRTLVWESPSNFRLPIVIQVILSCRFPEFIHEKGYFYPGDCHASVRYFIAMTWNSTNSNLPQCRFTSKNFLYGNYITTFSKLQCLSGHIWGGRELSGKRYRFRRNKYLLFGALVVRCMWWRLGFCQRTTALFCRTRRIYRIS